MKIFTAPEPVITDPKDIKIFLAGGITNCWEWQKELIEVMQDKFTTSELDRMVLINPRRENFPIDDPTAATKQIYWEYYNLERCDIFSMFFAKGDSDQPICMYELGRNIVKMQMRFPNTWKERIVVTAEEGYKRIKDVRTQMEYAASDIRIRSDLFEHIFNIRTLYRGLKFSQRGDYYV